MGTTTRGGHGWWIVANSPTWKPYPCMCVSGCWAGKPLKCRCRGRDDVRGMPGRCCGRLTAPRAERKDEA